MTTTIKFHQYFFLGSAASLSFNYCLLLLTMSRNLMTKLKESQVHQYIPLDSHLQFHKIVACTALFFSVLHRCVLFFFLCLSAFNTYPSRYIFKYLITEVTIVNHSSEIRGLFFMKCPNERTFFRYFQSIYLLPSCTKWKTK